MLKPEKVGTLLEREVFVLTKFNKTDAFYCHQLTLIRSPRLKKYKTKRRPLAFFKAEFLSLGCTLKLPGKLSNT